MFAVIRALVIAGTVALAFGLNLSHGYWLPIAAMVAMKPSLQQATLIAVQRLAGALIGAVAAALLLLIPASEHGLRLFAIDRGLEVVALVLLMHGAAIRFWNYALYCGAIAAGVLILVDLPQPSNYSAEGYRLLWTLCGAGIGVLVMLLAGLLAKRTARLADAFRYEPCSPTCANWLRYGIQPRTPVPACSPAPARARPTAVTTSVTPGGGCWCPASGPARRWPTTAPTAGMAAVHARRFGNRPGPVHLGSRRARRPGPHG